MSHTYREKTENFFNLMINTFVGYQIIIGGITTIICYCFFGINFSYDNPKCAILNSNCNIYLLSGGIIWTISLVYIIGTKNVKWEDIICYS